MGCKRPAPDKERKSFMSLFFPAQNNVILEQEWFKTEVFHENKGNHRS
ncbi:hypothetical protein B4135_0025 [Caldibacillus debilis]|uniref:Uncharacterized protein n=1 Tax=Caldibacillus debilis TaxID=301148 RepID=A0A150M2P3_9BACI|nr:hypothetical protein B4135_0025 [Caldibacillus debilis]